MYDLFPQICSLERFIEFELSAKDAIILALDTEKNEDLRRLDQKQQALHMDFYMTTNCFACLSDVELTFNPAGVSNAYAAVF